MNETNIRYIAGAGLFILWAALVFALKLDPSELIGTIKWGLGALFSYHAITNLQGTSQLTAILQALQQSPAPAASPKSPVPIINPKEAP